MNDIEITKIGPIVTEPATDLQPIRLSIAVLTSNGPKTMAISGSVAIELASAIVKHMRDEQLRTDAARSAR